MEYKLIQCRDKDLIKFNSEVNSYLKEGWTLHGNYRITVVESFNSESYIVNSQLLQKEVNKSALGFSK